jgi:regulatory protein
MTEPVDFLSPEKARSKALRYCSYQERCCKEVSEKLRSYGLSTDQISQLIEEFLREGFVSETRYASAYARGKFRQRGWGRERIIMELEHRDIGTSDISCAFEEILEEEYQEKLKSILVRKAKEWAAEPEFDRRGKMARFAIRRGFETELVWRIIKLID